MKLIYLGLIYKHVSLDRVLYLLLLLYISYHLILELELFKLVNLLADLCHLTFPIFMEGGGGL